MRSTTRRPLAALITTIVAATLLAGTASPSAAAPETLRLGDLPKGPAPATPYVFDGTLHDGTISVTLPKGVARFVGRVGADYLVQGYSPKVEKEVVVRVTAAGARTTVATGISLSDATVSDDGTSFVASQFKLHPRPQGRTVLRRYDAATGDVTLKKIVKGYAGIIDYDGTIAVLGGFAPTWTSAWDLTTNSVRRLVKAAGYEADIAADRLAVFTKDPYLGGCTEVSALSDPGRTIWRSCDEAVEEFSPDGSHMATIFILTDGLGPGRFTLRTTTGKNLGVYDAPFYFGWIWFEDNSHVLAEAFARTKGALVRCDSGGCERATAIKAHKTP